MGFEYINEDVFLATYDLAKDDTSHLMVDRAAEQYRTDWNWLMVVVKRVDLIILDESVNSILEEPAESKPVKNPVTQRLRSWTI